MTVTVKTVTISEEQVRHLTRLLRAQPGLENAELAGQPEPLSGGLSASISLLRLANAESPPDRLVLRVLPDDDDAAKEAIFQREVARQGFPVPAVRLAGGRDAGLGGPFLVMDYAAGRTPLANLDGLAAIRQLRQLARDLPALLGEVAARLHALDPGPVRAALRDTPVTAAADPSALLAGLEVTAAEAGRADLAAAARWLAARCPAAGLETVCHGDLQPFNLLVDGTRGWTLLDWSTALIADPACDLAFTMMILRQAPLITPPLLRPVITTAGAGLARRFAAAYCRAVPTRPSPEALAWFGCLHALRVLVEVEGWRPDNAKPGRPDHPWMAIGPWAARRLSRRTGITICWLPEAQPRVGAEMPLPRAG